MIQLIFAIVKKLVVVDVHNEGFASTGCHPEGEFLDVHICEVCIHGVAGGSYFVATLDKSVELAQEFLWSIEFPIQENFCVKQRKVLKIAEDDWL